MTIIVVAILVVIGLVSLLIFLNWAFSQNNHAKQGGRSTILLRPFQSEARSPVFSDGKSAFKQDWRRLGRVFGQVPATSSMIALAS